MDIMKNENMDTVARRVLVIGLDGATPEYLFQWAKEGHLPNIDRLIKNGAWGPAESTIPPFTPPAWVSFYTGTNPGKHGIFSFFEDLRGHERKPVTGKSVRAKPLWKILNEHGKWTIVMSVPITYPPEKLNGIMISGMDTPGEMCEFTYPTELKSELISAGYKIFPDKALMYSGDNKKLYNEVNQSAKVKIQIFKQLLSENPWDFAMIVLNEVDVISHFLIDQMLDLYKEVDAYIGELLSSVDEGTAVIIISDHGVKPFKATLYVDEILRDLGLLKIHQKSNNISKRTMQRIGISRQHLKALAKHLGLDEWSRSHMPSKVLRVIPTNSIGLLDINMEQSKLYFNGGYWLHQCKGTEITSEEITNLTQVLKRYGCRLYSKHHVYHGPSIDLAPDFMLYSDDHIFTTGLYNGQFTGPLEKRPGEHTLQGVGLVSGDTSLIQPGQIKSSIIDWAPTILYLLGLPVPSDMDGEVLIEAIHPKILKKRPIKMADSTERTRILQRVLELKASEKI